MIRIFTVVIALFFSQSVIGQQFELGLMVFPNIVSKNEIYKVENNGISLNGGGIKLAYKSLIKQSRFNYNAGLEFSFNDWGNQIISRLGAAHNFHKFMSVEAFLLNGVALYFNNSAYIFGMEANLAYFIYIKNKPRIKLYVGLRYSQNFKYKTIGNFRFLDVPIGLCWQFGK